MILSQEEKDLLKRFAHREKEPVSCRDKYGLALQLVEKGVLQFALFGAFRLKDPKYLEEEKVTVISKNTEKTLAENEK